MAPFAGLIFLLVCFYMLTGRFKRTGDWTNTGIITLEQLPAFPSSCYISLDPNGAGGCVISLNTRNQFSFALPGVGQNFQAKIISHVASQHGIKFTNAQLIELQLLPFLACDVEQLPSLLAIPTWERQKLINRGAIGQLSKEQLIECIGATRTLASKLLKWPVFYYLKVHAEAKSTQFFSLTDILQGQGINRFNLLANAKK